MQRGKFISFEGGEGSGKSTQIAMLRDSLIEKGHSVTATREPGGSPGAEEIRNLLVTGAPDRWDPMTEALLHFAARRDHLVNTVRPALERGDWVLCDRFVDSTVAYQAYGHGLERSIVDRLRCDVIGDLMPDLTLIIDIPPDIGLKRAAARVAGQATEGAGNEDRYERMNMAFHERLRAGFLEIAENEPERCAVIDGAGEPAAVHAQIAVTTVARFGIAL
ncbi:MAG: dTMP kinase [Proteobacteria bacterium]|nr:dTMP kinase [Pseudomonadota bacterium]